MLNLKVYSGRELQNFLAVLNQFETAGVTEIRFVREQIHNHFHDVTLKGKVAQAKNKQERVLVRSSKRAKVVKIPFIQCPKCEKGRLLPVDNPDGLNTWGCKKCRYSEIREVQDVQ